MTHKFLKTSLLALLVMLCFSCEKDGIFSKVYFGQIAALRCGTAVISVNSTTKGLDGVRWQGHPNAVSVKNYCLLTDMGLQQGDQISFRVAKDPDYISPGNIKCAREYCLSQGPDYTITVYDVEK